MVPLLHLRDRIFSIVFQYVTKRLWKYPSAGHKNLYQVLVLLWLAVRPSLRSEPGRLACNGAAAAFGQLADQPVRLDRIADPGFCPALLHAAADGSRRYRGTAVVEQRQLAARLIKAATQIPGLCDSRPHIRRLVRFRLPRDTVEPALYSCSGDGSSSCQHSMITVALRICRLASSAFGGSSEPIS